MNMPTTRTLLRLLPALVILAVVAVGTMGAGAVSPDTVAQTESPGTADASSPNAYDYVDDETGVVTTNGLIDAIEDFRRGPPNDISTETLLDVLESFRSGTPLAGFEFTRGLRDTVVCAGGARDLRGDIGEIRLTSRILER
jgi:hypothetical protein